MILNEYRLVWIFIGTCSRDASKIHSEMRTYIKWNISKSVRDELPFYEVQLSQEKVVKYIKRQKFRKQA